MNYYSHHIGDYLSATAHLTLLEHGAYRRLIDVYYIHEAPLPSEKKQVYRLVGARTKEEKEAVDSVLFEFFKEDGGGWIQARCDREIAITNKNRKNGGKGGRPPKNINQNETQAEPKQEPNGNPNETQTESPRHPSPNHPITGVSVSEQPAAASDALPPEKQNPPPPHPGAKDRANILAARLAALETKRLGRNYRVSGEDDRVAAWGAAGVTDPQFREAYEIALDRRLKKDGDQPISPGFLHKLILSLLADEGKTVAPIVIKAWHETPAGIEEKAKELGVPREPGNNGLDPFPAFKARVFAAAGMLAEAA